VLTQPSAVHLTLLMVFLQVPVPCSPNHQLFKATKWLVESCRDKERKIPMHQKLAWELLEAYNHEVRTHTFIGCIHVVILEMHTQY
jgi:ribosomal protein S7